jgi:hypothetical protein
MLGIGVGQTLDEFWMQNAKDFGGFLAPSLRGVVHGFPAVVGL